MVPIVKVQLTHEERRGLEEMALRNLRLPAQELRWLLREALREQSPAPVNAHFNSNEIGSVESRGKFTHAANGPAQPTHGTKTPRG